LKILICRASGTQNDIVPSGNIFTDGLSVKSFLLEGIFYLERTSTTAELKLGSRIYFASGPGWCYFVYLGGPLSSGVTGVLPEITRRSNKRLSLRQ